MKSKKVLQLLTIIIFIFILVSCKDTIEYDDMCHYKVNFFGERIEVEEHIFNSWNVEKEATCEDNGQKNSKCDKCDYVDKRDINPMGHNYNGETIYQWSEDYSILKAKRICLNDNSHTEEETVSSEYSVVKEPTYTESGLGIYKSDEFKNDLFESQTYEIPIPKLDTVIYKVTFYDKDKNIIHEEEVEGGTSVTPPEAPNVEGFVFERWDKELDYIKSDLEVNAIYVEEVIPKKFVVLNERNVMLVGTEIDLDVIVYPLDSTYRNIIWSVDNEEIATIDEEGVIIALNVGEVTIKAVLKINDTDLVYYHNLEIVSEEDKISEIEWLTIESEKEYYLLHDTLIKYLEIKFNTNKNINNNIYW